MREPEIREKRLFADMLFVREASMMLLAGMCGTERMMNRLNTAGVVSNTFYVEKAVQMAGELLTALEASEKPKLERLGREIAALIKEEAQKCENSE